MWRDDVHVAVCMWCACGVHTILKPHQYNQPHVGILMVFSHGPTTPFSTRCVFVQMVIGHIHPGASIVHLLSHLLVVARDVDLAVACGCSCGCIFLWAFVMDVFVSVFVGVCWCNIMYDVSFMYVCIAKSTQHDTVQHIPQCNHKKQVTF